MATPHPESNPSEDRNSSNEAEGSNGIFFLEESTSQRPVVSGCDPTVRQELCEACRSSFCYIYLQTLHQDEQKFTPYYAGIRVVRSIENNRIRLIEVDENNIEVRYQRECTCSKVDIGSDVDHSCKYSNPNPSQISPRTWARFLERNMPPKEQRNFKADIDIPESDPTHVSETNTSNESQIIGNEHSNVGAIYDIDRRVSDAAETLISLHHIGKNHSETEPSDASAQKDGNYEAPTKTCCVEEATSEHEDRWHMYQIGSNYAEPEHTQRNIYPQDSLTVASLKPNTTKDSQECDITCTATENPQELESCGSQRNGSHISGLYITKPIILKDTINNVTTDSSEGNSAPQWYVASPPIMGPEVDGQVRVLDSFPHGDCSGYRQFGREAGYVQLAEHDTDSQALLDVQNGQFEPSMQQKGSIRSLNRNSPSREDRLRNLWTDHNYTTKYADEENEDVSSFTSNLVSNKVARRATIGKHQRQTNFPIESKNVVKNHSDQEQPSAGYGLTSEKTVKGTSDKVEHAIFLRWPKMTIKLVYTDFDSDKELSTEDEEEFLAEELEEDASHAPSSTGHGNVQNVYTTKNDSHDSNTDESREQHVHYMTRCGNENTLNEQQAELPTWETNVEVGNKGQRQTLEEAASPALFSDRLSGMSHTEEGQLAHVSGHEYSENAVTTSRHFKLVDYDLTSDSCKEDDINQRFSDEEFGIGTRIPSSIGCSPCDTDTSECDSKYRINAHTVKACFTEKHDDIDERVDLLEVDSEQVINLSEVEGNEQSGHLNSGIGYCLPTYISDSDIDRVGDEESVDDEVNNKITDNENAEESDDVENQKKEKRRKWADYIASRRVEYRKKPGYYEKQAEISRKNRKEARLNPKKKSKEWWQRQRERKKRNSAKQRRQDKLRGIKRKRKKKEKIDTDTEESGNNNGNTSTSTVNKDPGNTSATGNRTRTSDTKRNQRKNENAERRKEDKKGPTSKVYHTDEGDEAGHKQSKGGAKKNFDVKQRKKEYVGKKKSSEKESTGKRTRNSGTQRNQAENENAERRQEENKGASRNVNDIQDRDGAVPKILEGGATKKLPVKIVPFDETENAAYMDKASIAKNTRKSDSHPNQGKNENGKARKEDKKGRSRKVNDTEECDEAGPKKSKAGGTKTFAVKKKKIENIEKETSIEQEATGKRTRNSNTQRDEGNNDNADRRKEGKKGPSRKKINTEEGEEAEQKKPKGGATNNVPLQKKKKENKVHDASIEKDSTTDKQTRKIKVRVTKTLTKNEVHSQGPEKENTDSPVARNTRSRARAKREQAFKDQKKSVSVLEDEGATSEGSKKLNMDKENISSDAVSRNTRQAKAQMKDIKKKQKTNVNLSKKKHQPSTSQEQFPKKRKREQHSEVEVNELSTSVPSTTQGKKRPKIKASLIVDGGETEKSTIDSQKLHKPPSSGESTIEEMEVDVVVDKRKTRSKFRKQSSLKKVNNEEAQRPGLQHKVSSSCEVGRDNSQRNLPIKKRKIAACQLMSNGKHPERNRGSSSTKDDEHVVEDNMPFVQDTGAETSAQEVCTNKPQSVDVGASAATGVVTKKSPEENIIRSDFECPSTVKQSEIERGSSRSDNDDDEVEEKRALETETGAETRVEEVRTNEEEIIGAGANTFTYVLTKERQEENILASECELLSTGKESEQKRHTSRTEDDGDELKDNMPLEAETGEENRAKEVSTEKAESADVGVPRANNVVTKNREEKKKKKSQQRDMDEDKEKSTSLKADERQRQQKKVGRRTNGTRKLVSKEGKELREKKDCVRDRKNEANAIQEDSNKNTSYLDEVMKLTTEQTDKVGDRQQDNNDDGEWETWESFKQRVFGAKLRRMFPDGQLPSEALNESNPDGIVLETGNKQQTTVLEDEDVAENKSTCKPDDHAPSLDEVQDINSISQREGDSGAGLETETIVGHVVHVQELQDQLATVSSIEGIEESKVDECSGMKHQDERELQPDTSKPRVLRPVYLGPLTNDTRPWTPETVKLQKHKVDLRKRSGPTDMNSYDYTSLLMIKNMPKNVELVDEEITADEESLADSDTFSGEWDKESEVEYENGEHFSEEHSKEGK